MLHGLCSTRRKPHQGEGEIHKQLHEKHEYARIEAIGIEHTLETQNRPWW